MKILIIRVSSIGDVIHTLPAIFLIKTCIVNVHITWIVQEKAAHLIKEQSFLDRVVVIPNRYLSPRHLLKTLHIIRELNASSWDAIIDFQGLLKTSFLYTFLRGEKFGFSWRAAREPLSSLFTRHHTQPTYTNIIQKNLSLASDVITHLTTISSCPTIETLRTTFYLDHQTADQAIVNEWITKHALKKIIALCPNTTWKSKKWPQEYWQELIQLCLQRLPTHQLVLIGKDFGPDAHNLAVFAQENNLPVGILPAWDLAKTTFFLRTITLLIAPDTSFLHLADFLGVRALGIFGPTSKKRHGPFLYTDNIQHAVQISCPHDYEKTHRGGSCMHQLHPRDILEHICEICLP